MRYPYAMSFYDDAFVQYNCVMPLCNALVQCPVISLYDVLVQFLYAVPLFGIPFVRCLSAVPLCYAFVVPSRNSFLHCGGLV